MIIKPTSSKGHQIGWLVVRTSYPGEVTPPAMFSRIIVQAHKGDWLAQFTDVLSLFSSSCIIMMMCSGYVMGQAWFPVKLYGIKESVEHCQLSRVIWISGWRVHAQINSESTLHNYVVTFHPSEHWKGPYFKKPQGIRQSMASYSWFRCITQEGIIGEKIEAYHSLWNQKYNLHSRSNDCTWGYRIRTDRIA